MDSPAQTTRGKVLRFYVEPQNGLVALVVEKMCFPGGFRDKIDPLSLNRFFSESEVYYKRNSSSLNTTYEKIEKLTFRTKLLLVRTRMILSSAQRSA